MTDIGRVGMVTKGDYNSASTYEVLDVVSYNGGLYIAKQNVPAGTTPTNTTYWQTCAAAVKKIVRSIATDSASGIFYLSQSDYHNIINVFVADNSAGAYNNIDGTRTLSYNSQHELVPDTTNALSLGTSSKQFKNIYGQNIYVNGTAVSSDRNKKKNIESLDERYKEFFKALRPVSFEYKDSPGKHTGFIAQEVEDAAEEAGLNAEDVGVVIEPESKQYYLAYQEIIAVQTKMIQELMQKVENLEARIKKLEAKGEN